MPKTQKITRTVRPLNVLKYSRLVHSIGKINEMSKMLTWRWLAIIAEEEQELAHETDSSLCEFDE